MHLRTAAALTAALALGAPAAPALAGGFTLDLAPQSQAVVGRPMIIRAAGTIPPADVGFPYWFSLDAIPASVTTTCPEDRWEGTQFATGAGGAIVVLSQSERPDVSGRFEVPVAVTPRAAGTVLLCGYTDDGEATTLAGGSLLLRIQPAGSRRPSPPSYAR